MKRPFKGLRTTEPDPSYDAVIIGAGIGGLFCANLLAREGLRVLLVEQHYMAGGYCSTFRRKGYTFDASTHFYPLLGNPDTLTGKLLVELGMKTRWVKMDPVDTFHFPDGTRFAVPAELDAYMSKVKGEFPHEAEALDRFFEEVREAYLSGLLYYFRGRHTARFEKYRRMTMRDVLDRCFRDRKLRLLLTADCPHWGSPPNRTSFVFDSMLRLSYFLGNYYPVHGSQFFADELGQRFEEQGGHILMSTRVDKIVVRDGKACGVELETTRGPLRGRRTVAAGTVISNADLLLTLEEMLGTEHVEPAYLDSVRAMRPSFPCFLVHIGLRDVPAKAIDEIQGYYWNHWDPDLVGRGGLRCKVFAPTLYEPRMAPPGGQIIILQKVLEMDYAGVEDWPAHKQEIEDYVLGHLDDVLPGASKKVEVHSSASARTAWRFTLNHAGAMLGWEMSPDQLGEDRPDNVGPVGNLFFVGHWTRPGGGITPVIVSAQQVAQAVVQNTRSLPVSADEIMRLGGALQGESRGGHGSSRSPQTEALHRAASALL
ncbi:MAG: NAD(P)/FAD-dependent oxidoreductase [bacterium]|nr:NAD(P)/FAD-dependent oxidoreductase [bacterium]